MSNPCQILNLIFYHYLKKILNLNLDSQVDIFLKIHSMNADIHNVDIFILWMHASTFTRTDAHLSLTIYIDHTFMLILRSLNMLLVKFHKIALMYRNFFYLFFPSYNWNTRLSFSSFCEILANLHHTITKLFRFIYTRLMSLEKASIRPLGLTFFLCWLISQNWNFHY